MTAPTPDQGAIERAREVYAAWKAVPIESSDYASEGLVKMFAAAITTAASEARAAAIEECARVAKKYEHVNSSVTDNDTHYWNGADDASEGIAYAIGALATPAQSLCCVLRTRRTLPTDQGGRTVMEYLHFELRFMDDETVLHRLALDDFQITVVKSEAPSFPGVLWTTLIVSLSGAQAEVIKAIPLKRFKGKFERASPQGDRQ